MALGIDDCLLRVLVVMAGVDVISPPLSRWRADEFEAEFEVEVIIKEEGTFLAGRVSAIGWVKVSAGI